MVQTRAQQANATQVTPATRSPRGRRATPYRPTTSSRRTSSNATRRAVLNAVAAAVTPVAAAQGIPDEDAMEVDELYDDLDVGLGSATRNLVRYSTKTNPYAGSINLESKHGVMVFDNGSKLPSGVNKMDPNYKNREAIWETVSGMDRNNYYVGALIPTDGTGAILPNATQENAFSIRDMVDVKAHMNLLDKVDFPNITKEAIMCYSSHVWGKVDQTLTIRTPQDGLIAYHVDPNASGLEGDIAKWKIGARTTAEMLYRLATNLVPTAAVKALRLHEKWFTYTCELTHRKIPCGYMVMWLILRKISPSNTIISMKYENEFRKITLKSFNDHLLNFVDRMEYLWMEMCNQYGEDKYHPQLKSEQMIRGVKTTSDNVNPAFGVLVEQFNLAWLADDDTFDLDAMIAKLSKYYQAMVAKNTWFVERKDNSSKQGTNPSSDKPSKVNQLVALKTRTQGFAAALATMIEKEAKKTAYNNNWGQFTKDGETKLNPNDGKKWKWCDKGHKDGCYMPPDHDHEKWEAERTKKRAARGKRSYVAATTAATDSEVLKPAAKKGKMKLDTNLQAVLTTKLSGYCMSNEEIRDVLDAVNNNDDSSSKE